MTTSTRTRMRPEERRQQILNVALDLFAQRGFEEVTIGDIASAMNIVRPTIYIYFPSTNAILDAIFDDLLNSYWQKIEPIIRNSKGMPTPQTVSEIFRIILNEPHLLAILRCGGPSFQRKRHAQFDKKLNVLHMNPGAAGKSGFHQVRTMLRFSIDGEKISDLEIIEIEKRV